MTSLLVNKTPPKEAPDNSNDKILLPPTPPPSGGKHNDSTILYVEPSASANKKVVATPAGQPVAVTVKVASSKPQPIAPAPFMCNTIRVQLCEPPQSHVNLNTVTLNTTTTPATFYATAGTDPTNNQTQLVAISSKSAQKLKSSAPQMPLLIVTRNEPVQSSGSSLQVQNLTSIASPTMYNSTLSGDNNSSTPSSSQSSNSEESSQKSESGKNKNRVGRPKKSDVQQLQAEGEISTSEMKCLVCKRVFPRIKSLEAHMRIHTGTVE